MACLSDRNRLSLDSNGDHFKRFLFRRVDDKNYRVVRAPTNGWHLVVCRIDLLSAYGTGLVPDPQADSAHGDDGLVAPDCLLFGGYRSLYFGYIIKHLVI